jgi:restriction system protein
MTSFNHSGGSAAVVHVSSSGGGTAWDFPLVSEPLLIQALVTRERQTDDGFLILAIEPAWLRISELVAKNPSALMELTPEQLEELVAASYDKAGYDEVVLTPRSGDFGRDVIATRYGWGSIRIIDQVKRYRSTNLVTANDVRALLGVLNSDRNASNGIVTTTSTFAPKIAEDPGIAPFIPHRLELVNGSELAARIIALNATIKA